MKFRRAKNLNTLEIMSNRAQEKALLTASQIADIVRAQCHREREIMSGRLIVLKTAIDETKY